jgi:hypothetical protein
LGLLLAAGAAPASGNARENVQKCEDIDTKAVKLLLYKWNESLRDNSATKVLALYANDATLLPTVENGPYTKTDGMKDYFVHFVALRPVATIDETRRVYRDRVQRRLQHRSLFIRAE